LEEGVRQRPLLSEGQTFCSGQVKTDTQLSSLGETFECVGTDIPQI
jgi:hypothetical protein